jgi:hypothetical protein
MECGPKFAETGLRIHFFFCAFGESRQVIFCEAGETKKNCICSSKGQIESPH